MGQAAPLAMEPVSHRLRAVPDRDHGSPPQTGAAAGSSPAHPVGSGPWWSRMRPAGQSLRGFPPAGCQTPPIARRASADSHRQIIFSLVTDHLESPHALPVPVGVVPHQPDHSLGRGHIGTPGRDDDFTPCLAGVSSHVQLDPEGHSGVPRGRIGARRSDRSLSTSLALRPGKRTGERVRFEIRGCAP